MAESGQPEDEVIILDPPSNHQNYSNQDIQQPWQQLPVPQRMSRPRGRPRGRPIGRHGVQRGPRPRGPYSSRRSTFQPVYMDSVRISDPAIQSDSSSVPTDTSTAQPTAPEPSSTASPQQRPNLSWFSDEEIVDKLMQRGHIFICRCGCVFLDRTLYNIHLASHHTKDCRRCSSCGYLSADWSDFIQHFVNHKQPNL